MSKLKKNCGTCRYWVKTKSTIGGGLAGPISQCECRRNAPLPMLSEDLVEYHQAAYWPLTMDTDFCGEWKKR